MNTIFTLLMVLIGIASVLLVIVVMAQNPKGGGLSGTFGGASSAQFGVQRTNDFMEKATWTLGISIGILCLLSVVLTAKPTTNVPQVVPQNTTTTTTKKENTADKTNATENAAKPVEQKNTEK